jgi:hypothetical protein
MLRSSDHDVRVATLHGNRDLSLNRHAPVISGHQARHRVERSTQPMDEAPRTVMKAPIRVQHKGQELTLQAPGKLIVRVVLLRSGGIPNSSNTTVTGSDGPPTLRRRMDHGHITEQGHIGQVHLNVRAQFTRLMQVSRLDARWEMGKVSKIPQVMHHTMVTDGDTRTALLPAAERVPRVFCSSLLMVARHAIDVIRGVARETQAQTSRNAPLSATHGQTRFRRQRSEPQRGLANLERLQPRQLHLTRRCPVASSDGLSRNCGEG